MYSLLISFAIATGVFAIFAALFSPWAAIIPATLALVLANYLLARRVGKKIQELATEAQKEIQAASTSTSKEMQKQRMDKGIKLLEQGFKYDKWQFLVGAEIHAQIGMIKYMTKDLEGAQTHFAKAHSRNYMARAMEGALFFQKKDFPKMEEAFEHAVKSGKKEALVWAVYAWCELQRKDKDKALKIMGRAVEANPSDDKLKAGLTALQNDKKLKMKAYEPLWWQFGLEAPPMELTGGRRVQFVRR